MLLFPNKVPAMGECQSLRTVKAEQESLRMQEGALISSDIVIKVLKSYILNSENKKILLDGYPRNIAQAEELDKMLEEKGTKLDLVAYLKTPTEEIIERVMARRECPKCKRVYNMVLNKPKNDEICDDCGVELTKRVDDTEEKLKTRLDIFFNETEPVINFYKEKGIVKEEEISVSINRLAPEAARDLIDSMK